MQKNLVYIALIAGGLSLTACGSGRQAAGSGKPDKGELPEKVKFQFDDRFFQAQREKVLGNNKEAIGLFKEALEINPKAHAVHYEMAEIYLLIKNGPSAYDHMVQAVALEKNNPFYYSKLAEACAMTGRYEEAAKAMEARVKLRPGEVDTWFDWANQFVYAKNYAKAVEVYDKMEKKFGMSEEVIRQKEQLYLAMGKPEKALKEVQRLVDAYPNEPRFLGLLAELYQGLGKTQEAFDLYQKILQADPSNGYAHFGLAEYYRNKNEKDPMLRELELAFLDPEIASENKLNVVFSLVPLIDQDPSLKAPVFKLASVIRDVHSDEAMPHAVMGDLYLADRQPELAIPCYEQSLMISPGEFNVWRQYLTILEGRQENKKLQKQSEEALEYFPNQVILYYFNAASSFRLKEYNHTIEMCKMGLGLESSEDEVNILLHTLMGDSYQQLEKYQESEKAYDAALLIDPNDGYVLNNYAYYLALRDTRLEKARVMSEKAIKMEPSNASYLDTYGYILFRLTRYEEAVFFFEEALQNGGASEEVYEHTGDNYWKLKNKDKALENWKKALEINPNSSTLKQKIADINK